MFKSVFAPRNLILPLLTSFLLALLLLLIALPLSLVGAELSEWLSAA